jgi:ABC-type thiamine transport system ATPase subunit
LRDQKPVKALDEKFAAADYRMREMVQLVVSSELFNKHANEEKILAP